LIGHSNEFSIAVSRSTIRLKMSKRERAERSLFWYGEFRECPAVSEQAKEEAFKAVVFWHGEEAVDPEILGRYRRDP